MKNKETQIQWLQNEIKKDQEDLEKEKNYFIQHIKNLKKDDVVKPKTEIKKLTLWQKIKTVLNLN
jgi:hypothetical protein